MRIFSFLIVNGTRELGELTFMRVGYMLLLCTVLYDVSFCFVSGQTMQASVDLSWVTGTHTSLCAARCRCYRCLLVPAPLFCIFLRTLLTLVPGKYLSTLSTCSTPQECAVAGGGGAHR